MKKSYTHIKAVEFRIIEMREAGRTRQEIADELGLTKQQIKWWVSRHNRSKSRLKVGIVPKDCGRPRRNINARSSG
jgi:orotate phosphoribosyltransferase-like protein